ncbi:hypothetical protein ACNF7A_09380, partial [Campylobacter coli]
LQIVSDKLSDAHKANIYKYLNFNEIDNFKLDN